MIESAGSPSEAASVLFYLPGYRVIGAVDRPGQLSQVTIASTMSSRRARRAGCCRRGCINACGSGWPTCQSPAKSSWCWSSTASFVPSSCAARGCSSSQ